MKNLSMKLTNQKCRLVKCNILFILLTLISFSLSGQDDCPEATDGLSSVIFSLDGCTAFFADGSNADYTEFTPENNNRSECADMLLLGRSLYRNNPAENPHSCTPGVNGTEGMCVGVGEGCDFSDDSDQAIRFDIELSPANGLAQLKELKFYEKGPERYVWVDGESGPNNYPTAYGVRITVGGTELYKRIDIPTNKDWSLQTIDLSQLDGFTVDKPTIFSFELLAYCPIGNGAELSIWDVDDIRVYAGCETDINGGQLTTIDGSYNIDLCVGEAVSYVFAPTLEYATGENQQWVLTDANGQIIGLPTGPSFDFADFGEGPCSLYNVSYDGDIFSLLVGSNLSEISGCFDLSNAIDINKKSVEGAALDFDIAFDGCGNTNEISISLSTDGDDLPVGVDASNNRWEVTQGAQSFMGTGNPFTFTLTDNAAIEIALFNEADNGCELVTQKSFDPKTMTGEDPRFRFDLSDCSDKDIEATFISEYESLNGVPVSSYDWVFFMNNNSFEMSGRTVSVQIPSRFNLMVRLKLTLENGCSFSVTEAVDFGDVPSVKTFSNPIYVCDDAETRIISNPNNDWFYNWVPETGLTFNNTSKSNPVFNSNRSQKYKVTVASPLCTIEEEIEIIVLEDIIIDVIGDITNCSPRGTLMINDPDNISYEWATDVDFENTLGRGTTIAYNFTGQTEQNVYVRATAPNGCVSKTQKVDITITDGIDLIFTDGGDGIVEVCEGIGGRVIMNPNPQWTYTWSPMTGISGELSNPEINPTEATTYSVTVTSGDCEVIGEVEVVPGNQIDIAVRGVDEDGTLNTCAGSANLFVMGMIDPSYEWSTDSDFSNIISTQPSLDVTSDGTYYVRGILDECTSEVEEITVTLGNGPSIEFTDDGDGNIQVCEVSGGMIVKNPNPTWTYIWSPTTDLSGDLYNPIVNPSETTIYKVTVTDGNCEAYGEVEVVPNNLLDISIVGTDINGNVNVCSRAATLTAVGNFDPNYEWATESSFSNIIATTSRVVIAESGTYFVRATLQDGCQSEVEMITVTLGDGPFVEFIDGGDGVVDVCADKGAMILLNPNPDWTYTWSPMQGITGDLSNPKVNPMESTIYTVTVSDGSCEAVEQVEVRVGGIQEIEVLGKNSNGEIDVCSSTTTLMVTGSCEPSYEWSRNNDFSEVISSQEFLNVTTAGTYYVRAVVEGSCTSEVEEIIVTLGAGPGIDFTGGDDGIAEVCGQAGGMIVMDPNPDWTYTWSPDEIAGDPSNPKFIIDGTTKYTVTITDGSCEATGMIIVSPGDRLEIEIQDEDENGTVAECGGEKQLVVRGNCEPNYEWSTTPGFTEIIGNSDRITVTNSGSYYVRAIIDDDVCESEVEQIDVDLGSNDLSIEFMGGDDGVVDLCEGIGGMIIMNGNPDLIYTWSPMDGISGDLFNPLVSPNETTTYTITVTDGTCEAVEQITVNPTDKTEIGVLDLDADDEIKSCSSQVDVTVMGNSEGTYQWSTDPDFENIIATESVITINETGTYFVRATLSTSCESEVVQFDVVLSEDSDISLEFVGDNDIVQVCEGVGGKIIANPNPEWTYTWSPTEGISGELSNPTVNPTENTVYSVTVSDGDCEITGSIEVLLGDQMTISVDGLDADGTLEVCGASETVIATGNSNSNYEWSRTSDFVEILSNDETYTITELGTYYVRAITGDETCTSNVVEINAVLGDGPSIEFIDGGEGTVEICMGVGGMIVSNPNPDWTYTWSPMDGLSGDLSNPVINPTETTTYSVTVSDGACETERMIQVIPGDTLEIAVQGADSEGRVLACDGETVVLSVSGNPEDNYEWSINENFDPIISTNSELTTQISLGDDYYVRAVVEGCNSEVEKVTLSDITGDYMLPEGTVICPGDTITVTLEASNNAENISIVWDEDDHIISDLNGNEITVISLEGDGDISLSFTKTTADGSCMVQDSVVIPMGMMMDNIEVITNVNCATLLVCFETSEEDGRLVWDFGDDSTTEDVSTEGSPCYFYPGPGEYVAVVSGQSGCSIDEMFISVLISDPVSITTMEDEIQFCEGEELTLSANSDIPQNIYWASSNGDTLGTGPSIMFSPTSDTTIFAIVTDGATCRDSVDIFLDGYFFDVEVMQPDAVCPGEELSIEAINNGTDSLTYLWGPEECIMSGGDTPTPEVVTSLSKDLFLTVTSVGSGCVKEFTIPIIISDLELALSADPDTVINRGESVDITAGADGDSLVWAWSNGETTESILVQPEETTTYNVQVTDPNGCEADGTIIINVIQPVCDTADVYIPTGFSPNGDGVNDELVVRSNFIKEMQLDIYDRWGEEVFNTSDQRTAWNGMFQNTGEELHSDTYAYCLKVTCTNDLTFTMLGNVTLVR